MVRVPRMSPQAVSAVAQKLVATSKEAQRALPSSQGGETPLSLQTYVTKAYTHFTNPSLETELLYSAENWVRMKLELKTAGPVAWGTDESLTPVLSGKGILLETDEETDFYLPKGTRVYITSQTVNRINVIIEPVPWLEQLDGDVNTRLDKVVSAVERMSTAVVNAIDALRGMARPMSRDGNRVDQQGAPRPTRTLMPRLTGVAPSPRKF